MSHKTLHTRIAAAMLVAFFFATSMPETVRAINTNIPGLLVNTESFQTIDPGDGTSVIDLRFGETLNARLYYDISANRFNFTKDMWVQGALTATGALTTKGTLSGNTLVISSNASVSGSIVVVGDTTVHGTISGATLRASNMTVSGAVVYSSGNLLKQTAKGLSGQLLISQGTSAPVWKDQKTSLVWYLDSTIAPGSNQSAIVTMPFGLVASTGSLRIKGAPTGSSLIVDLKQDGTSIFSSLPTIPADAISAKNGVFSTTDLTEGSEISLSVTQVGSTFAGSGLTIMLTGTRKY